VKLLDTNVFVYARGRPHPFKDPCRRVLAGAEADRTAFGIDVEMLQELLDLYVRRGRRAEATAMVEDALTAFPDPFAITRREIEECSDVLMANALLSPRDAVHAAVCRTYGLEGLVSTDREFDGTPGIVRFDPVELAREMS
jgi:predicted nucleic acid-binding protein